MIRWLRLLVVLLALAVPFQGALAASAAQCMGLEHHDSHDGEDSGSHCGPCTACCTGTAITGAVPIVSASSSHEAHDAQTDLPLFGEPPSGLDRPPRSS